jgi:hypothetical protein
VKTIRKIRFRINYTDVKHPQTSDIKLDVDTDVQFTKEDPLLIIRQAQISPEVVLVKFSNHYYAIGDQQVCGYTKTRFRKSLTGSCYK